LSNVPYFRKNVRKNHTIQVSKSITFGIQPQWDFKSCSTNILDDTIVHIV